MQSQTRTHRHTHTHTGMGGLLGHFSHTSPVPPFWLLRISLLSKNLKIWKPDILWTMRTGQEEAFPDPMLVYWDITYTHTQSEQNPWLWGQHWFNCTLPTHTHTHTHTHNQGKTLDYEDSTCLTVHYPHTHNQGKPLDYEDNTGLTVHYPHTQSGQKPWLWGQHWFKLHTLLIRYLTARVLITVNYLHFERLSQLSI